MREPIFEYDALRWISRDPSGEGAGVNLYVYVSNNPIDLMDPFGMDAVPAPGGGYYFVVRPNLNLNNLAGSTITNIERIGSNASGQISTFNTRFSINVAARRGSLFTPISDSKRVAGSPNVSEAWLELGSQEFAERILDASRAAIKKN